MGQFFFAHGRSTLVVVQGNLTANQYRDQILLPFLLPFMQRHNPGLTFQHDNARPHTAFLTQDFLRNASVEVLDRPSRSPDFNPIEHIWNELDRSVCQQVNPPQTLGDLERALVFSFDHPVNLILTVPRLFLHLSIQHPTGENCFHISTNIHMFCGLNAKKKKHCLISNI